MLALLNISRAATRRPLAGRSLQMQSHPAGVLQCMSTHRALHHLARQSAPAERLGISKLMKRSASTTEPTPDLNCQVAELKSTCAKLTKQVELLTVLMQHNGCRNLLELQAAKGSGVPDRNKFQPTLDMVANQVNHASQLDNDKLVMLAISGDGFARRERLLREIMQADNCSWDEAHETLIEMDKFNEQRYWFCTMPYRIGIAGAIVAVFGSVLMVFGKSVSESYATHVAGEELPEGINDISEMTYNQVGTWTWSWMEPMIGTASFVLLCLQFGRAQSVKMNMHPYTEMMLRWRADRVAKEYPRYDSSMVRSWAKHMPAVGWNFFPKYRRRFYLPETRYQNFRGGT